jgi:hypothetical protein
MLAESRREDDAMKSRRYHHGIQIDLWTNQGAWFWRLVNFRSNRGSVGAAASEADAISEASTTIDELSSQSDAPDLGVSAWDAILGVLLSGFH